MAALEEIKIRTKSMKSFFLKIAELTPWFTAILVALSASWASDASKETLDLWFSGIKGEFSLSRWFYILFFLVSVMLLYHQRKSFFKPRTRYLRDENPEPRKHLVLFLSNLDTQKGTYNEGVPEGLTLSGCLESDIQKMEELKSKNPPLRWPWEMPLRAIRHHLPKLESITLVCSHKSILQVKWFCEICNKYDEIKNNINLFILAKNKDKQTKLFKFQDQISSENGLDFESFDELSDSIWSLINMLKKKGFKENEIIIDFTGGQKVTSVVAAATTFNRAIKGQYVQTNPDWEVKSYDVILAMSSTEGLGM